MWSWALFLLIHSWANSWHVCETYKYIDILRDFYAWKAVQLKVYVGIWCLLSPPSPMCIPMKFSGGFRLAALIYSSVWPVRIVLCFLHWFLPPFILYCSLKVGFNWLPTGLTWPLLLVKKIHLLFNQVRDFEYRVCFNTKIKWDTLLRKHKNMCSGEIVVCVCLQIYLRVGVGVNGYLE